MTGPAPLVSWMLYGGWKGLGGGTGEVKLAIIKKIKASSFYVSV